MTPIDELIWSVANELLREPAARTLLAAAPTSETRDRLEGALVAAVADRVREALDDDPEVAAYLSRYEELERAVDAALAAAAESSPAEFKTRRGLAELQEIQNRLADEEKDLRARAAGVRAELLTRQGKIAAKSKGPTPGERREVEDLERRYLDLLEQMQEKRRSIAEVVTSKKRLQVSLPAAERHIRERLVAEDENLRGIAADVDSLRRPIIERQLTTIRPHFNEVVSAAASSVALEDDLPLDDAEAEPEPDVAVGQHGIDAERQLRQRILELKQRAATLRARAQWATTAAIGLLTLLPLAVVVLDAAVAVLAAGYLLALSAAAFSIGGSSRQRARGYYDDFVDSQNELDLLRVEHEHPERRAQKMLQVNQLDLRRYYDQALRQGRLVFYLGVACIALGFGAVAGALLLLSGEDMSANEQVIVAALGGVAALLANFIGVIYLKMFSEIIRSVGAFHTRLVGTHDLYFGNFLAAKVGDPTQREQLFADLARDVNRTRNSGSDQPSAPT